MHRQTPARTAVAIAVAAALLLAGCSNGRPTAADTPTPTSTADKSLTPIVNHVKVQVTPESGGAYQEEVTVYGEPKYNRNTGELSVKYDTGVGASTHSIDSTVCGYRREADLVVPVGFGYRVTGKKPLTGRLTANFDTSYGFTTPDNIWNYVNSIVVLDFDDCPTSTVENERAISWDDDFSSNPQDAPSTNLINDIYFLDIVNGKKLSPESREKVLNALAVSFGPDSGVADGVKAKVQYLTPESTTVLHGNGCLEPFVNFSGTPNPAFVPLKQQGCDTQIFTRR